MTPTVVLLPGNMCDRRLWEGGEGALLDGIGRLGFDTVRPALDAPTVADMAAGVLAQTDGALIAIGFSMGAIVALDMARQARDRIVALGLIDANASADLSERAAQRPRQQAEVRAGRLEQVVVEELKPNYLATANRGDKALLALLRDMALSLGPDVFVRQSEALRTRSDLTYVLAGFAGPVFLACGAEDRLCPPIWHERWAGLARRSELHVIDGAGHMLPLEQPERLAASLLDWLSRVKDAHLCTTAS